MPNEKLQPANTPNMPAVSGGRNLANRPTLPQEYQERRDQMRREAESAIFFTFDKDDSAVVEMTNSKVINTKAGENVVHTGRYLSGNIHGTGGGAPNAKGDSFRFWDSTVLRSKLEELNAQPGDVILIDCLGEKKGAKFTYRDFMVEIVQAGPNHRSETPRVIPARVVGDETAE